MHISRKLSLQFVVSIFFCVQPSFLYSQELNLDGAGHLLTFLRQGSVLAELQLTDAQKQETDAIIGDLSKAMRGYASAGLRVRHDPQALGKLKNNLHKKFDELARPLERVLLPHQVIRYNQLYKRYHIYNGKRHLKFEHELLSPSLDGINLTGNQKTQVKTQAKVNKNELKKLLAKYRKELRELAEKQQNQMLELLTQEQRKEFEKILGPSFSFKESMTTIRQ